MKNVMDVSSYFWMAFLINILIWISVFHGNLNQSPFDIELSKWPITLATTSWANFLGKIHTYIHIHYNNNVSNIDSGQIYILSLWLWTLWGEFYQSISFVNVKIERNNSLIVI